MGGSPLSARHRGLDVLAPGYCPLGLGANISSNLGEKIDMAETIVKYRALAGDLCDAVLLEERDGIALIDVRFPQNGEGLRLSGIPLLAADDGRRGVCFPVAA